MRADLEAMRGQQHATNQLTSVLKLTTTPTISSATLTVTPPPLPTSSTMWPSRALLEAMRELPFLHDYPSLAGFAIPDFRHATLVKVAADKYPVLACVYPGNTIFDPVPPTILFANAAMCRLSGYTFRELVGALVTKVVVMQESARLKMGPFLSNKDPLSLSPVYSFNTLIRSRSGRLWRTLADSTQFFFGQNGTPKHIVVNLTQWEEGHLREGELPLDLDRLAFARAHGRCGRRATCSTNASAGDTHKLWPALPARAIADDDDDANGDGSFSSSSSSSSSSRSSSPPSPPTEEMALILQLLDSSYL
ncbi:uncharacterized protein ACA1_182190 [Acanthamoeba castellanii str. Neff]|uniref:PAS domain-containing protein n=1 Tax=Acanthamoeba castellanii (strain ATCC 30010 / Neff) TaxID=1257118 RepID=L8H9A4_ACACF|nr:uncharacterized protein ACA1_182190 [Acanthamoeba castellanii str. Neff]ELR21318.1 hypothetical protein ACA1_182190 [Acanthamoeba castellanii str. Neff]